MAHIDRNAIFGRGDVINQLDAYVSDVENNSSFVFLKGDPGIGKTTVLKGVISGFPDLLSIYVQCSSLTDGDELYKPCNDVFLALKGYEESKVEKKSKVKDIFSIISQNKALNISGKLLNLIPGLGTASTIIDIALTAMMPSDSNVDRQADHYQKDKIALYADLIIGVSKIRPLAIIFDDLQWADKGTTSVIKQIYQIFWEGVRTDNAQLCIICSMRDAEAKADKLHNGVNELMTFVNRYDKHMHSEIILNPLDRNAMLELIDYVFDNNVDISNGLTEWLISKAMGNPLLLETYINLLKSNSIVRSDDGMWKDDLEVETKGDDFVLKGKMLAAEKKGIFDNKAAVALEAVKNLTEDNLRVIYVASILDGAFPVDVLAKAVNMSEEELFWNLRSLEKVGLVSNRGAVNNGYEEVSRYEISSRILKEALQNDMAKRQVMIYEKRIALAYSEKADTIQRYIKVIESMSEAGMLPQNKIDYKKRELDRACTNMHKYAAIHYEKGGDILDAIENYLYAYKNSVDKFEESYSELPSPADLDTIINAVENQMKHFEQLFEEIINEILLEKSKDKERLQRLKIRYLTINAQFYKVFGYFGEATKAISDAQQLAMLTETDVDDVEMMKEMISIEYNSGNFSTARANVEKFVAYFEKHPTWKAEELEDIFDDISEYFNTDFVMANQYAQRIVKILINAKSEYVEGVLASYYEALLKNECYEMANCVFEQIESVNGVDAFLNYMECFCCEVTDENFIDYYSELCFDGDPPRICYLNAYNWRWRVNAADKILERLQYIGNNYELDNWLRCIMLECGFTLLCWLKQHVNLKGLDDVQDELDDDDYAYITEKYKCISDDIKLFTKMVHDILEKHESFFATESNIQFIKDNSATQIREVSWTLLMMNLLDFWPKHISISDYKEIIHKAFLSYELNRSDCIADVVEYALGYICSLDEQDEINKEGKRLLDYIENKIKDATDPGEKAKYIEKCILYNSDDFPEGVINEYEYFITAMNLYIEAKDTKAAMTLLDTYRDLDGFELPNKKKVFKEYNAKIQSINDENSTHRQKEYNVIGSNEDEFLKWKEAERIISTVYFVEVEDEDNIDAKQFIISALYAFSLVKENHLAESRRDDFCDEVVDIINSNVEYIDSDDIREIFGIACPEGDIWKICFEKILELLRESIQINKRLKDHNRTIEEYKKVFYYFVEYCEATEDDKGCFDIVRRVFGVNDESEVLDQFLREAKNYGRDDILLTFLVDSAYQLDIDEEGSIHTSEMLNAIIIDNSIRNNYIEYLEKYYPDNGIKKKVIKVINKEE